MQNFVEMSIEDSAKSLRKAMKGIGLFIDTTPLLPIRYKKIVFNQIKGTDESRIIKEICAHTKAERQEIQRAYLAMYGKVG